MPPEALERLIGFVIPPACREEVLGDLHEKFTGPVQYIVLAISVVPFVIVSRIRRTTDARVLLMGALLLYASYLSAAWLTDRALLVSQWGLLRLAVPAVLALMLMVLADAWSPVGEESSVRRLGQAVFGVLFAYLCTFRTLPNAVNLVGASASLVLVVAVRFLFVPQGATGPALWRDQKAGPAILSGHTKSLLAAALVIIMSAWIITWIGGKPGIVGMVVTIVGWAFVFAKSRKE
jgi:hypothetical protein